MQIISDFYERPKLRGHTAVLTDMSGSMNHPLSAKSSVRLCDAGTVMAAAIRGDHVDLIAWASTAKRMANWQSLSSALSMGMANVGHATNLEPALRLAFDGARPDRVIVVTDLQFADRSIPALPPGVRGYAINVGPYSNPGLLGGNWTHLIGFSTAVLKYIAAIEDEVDYQRLLK